MTTTAILIPAAGTSSRMRGRDKLLEPVDGMPLLRRQCLRAQATGAPVYVTLADLNSDRAKAIEGLALHVVWVPDAAGGMSGSLRHGVNALSATCTALLVVLPDMPDLTEADFTRFITAHNDGFSLTNSDTQHIIWRGATSAGKAGHPVLLPRSVFPEIAALSGDQGAKAILKRHASRVRLLTLPENRALLDLDTPEDWQTWQAHQR